MLRALKSITARVVYGGIAIMVVGSQLISPVQADAASGWLSQAGTQITKISQLPSNQVPSLSNRDCTEQSYLLANQTTGVQSDSSGCFVSSTLGRIGDSGTPLLFSGTSVARKVSPYGPYSLVPIPNQGATMATASAPVQGLYMHFYQDIRQKITSNASPITGLGTSYTINSEPDFSLRDRANARIFGNVNGTLSFSADGSWMVVDNFGSFIRVNLATFEILPFAPTLQNGPNDYGFRKAATAISDDGRYAAIASNDYGYFKVYDLSTCTGNTNDRYSQALSCSYRDYWPSVESNAAVSGLRGIYGLRFINDDNISMTAMYNYKSGTVYDVAKFTVTAPGKTAHSLDYLALGDSYISGEGEFQYKTGTDTDTNFCHQSPLSYPFLIGSSLFNQYNSVACSGATTNDVKNPYKDYTGQIKGNIKRIDKDMEAISTDFKVGEIAQWEFIKRYQPRVVTLSIGGNDMGFGKTLQSCIMDNNLSRTCFDTYDKRMRIVKAIESTYDKLRDTYNLISKQDPGVQLYVIGYPQVITHGNCGVNVQLNSTEIDLAQNIISYLNYTVEKAANSAGARYVDTQDAFVGHRLCEANASSLAMNGVTAGKDRGYKSIKFIGAETYHPNVFGHQLLAQAILRKTNNFRQVMPAADATISAPKPSDPLAVALLANYPNSGKIQPTVVINADGATDDIVYRTVGSTVTLGSTFGLKPSTGYQASLDDGASSIGSFITKNDGSLTFALNLPATTPTGYHTLSITGTNIAGESTEIFMTIYVAASETDLDGNGVPDEQTVCGVIADSGVDVDGDGFDDACDPVIGGTATSNFAGQVFLTGNTIITTQP